MGEKKGSCSELRDGDTVEGGGGRPKQTSRGWLTNGSGHAESDDGEAQQPDRIRRGTARSEPLKWAGP